MNLNDLANLGQIIGAIAVVVSLIYVALQIRQNTNAIRSAWSNLRIYCRLNSRNLPLISCTSTMESSGERLSRLTISLRGTK